MKAMDFQGNPIFLVREQHGILSSSWGYRGVVKIGLAAAHYLYMGGQHSHLFHSVLLTGGSCMAKMAVWKSTGSVRVAGVDRATSVGTCDSSWEG